VFVDHGVVTDDAVPSFEGLAVLVAGLRADVAELRAENLALRGENAALRAENERLRRQVSRNSGNSSMPPSSDDQPGRPQPRQRAKPGGGRSRGKQPGAPGTALAWSDSPDRVEPLYPAECGSCGNGLAEAAEAGVRARQVIEIPLITAKRTEFHLYKRRCSCGHVTCAELPPGVADVPVSYGPNLQSFAVYLLVVHAVPVERCQQLIADVSGARPSAGFVHGMLKRAAMGLAGFEKLVKTLLTLAHVVHFDETTLKCGARGTGRSGAKKYVWVASTGKYTAYFLGGRDTGSFTAFGIGQAFRGVAVHDRYDLYDRGVLDQAAGHQLCCSHLLRDLEDAAECYPGQHWPAQAQRALRGLIHEHHQARDAGLAQIPAAVRDQLISDFRHAVRIGLADLPRIPGPKSTTAQLPGRCLLEALRDRQDDVLRFVSDTAIPPTNNQAERDLRPLKTQQKISGRLQSEDTTRHRLTIRGYISTATKHGINAMTAILDAITGNPWTPTYVNM
jgi:transposase